jgi:hypothetical protein
MARWVKHIELIIIMNTAFFSCWGRPGSVFSRTHHVQQQNVGVISSGKTSLFLTVSKRFLPTEQDTEMTEPWTDSGTHSPGPAGWAVWRRLSPSSGAHWQSCAASVRWSPETQKRAVCQLAVGQVGKMHTACTVHRHGHIPIARGGEKGPLTNNICCFHVRVRNWD